MYNNPAAPMTAAAGIGGGITYLSGSMMMLYLLMAGFALIGAFWAMMRFLPASITEKPRTFVVRTFGAKATAPGRRLVKRYDFSRKNRR